MLRNCFAMALLIASQGELWAQSPEVPQWQPVAADATFLTGDTWRVNDITYRLYGVQSCLRGTYFTGDDGQMRDCGDVSLLMTIQLINHWHPVCYAVYRSQDDKMQLVICAAQIAQGQGSGHRVDLGTALVSSGFAFAALNSDGKPVDPNYLVSQAMAQKQRRGLWAFSNLPNPNKAILGGVGTSISK